MVALQYKALPTEAKTLFLARAHLVRTPGPVEVYWKEDEFDAAPVEVRLALKTYMSLPVERRAAVVRAARAARELNLRRTDVPEGMKAVCPKLEKWVEKTVRPGPGEEEFAKAMAEEYNLFYAPRPYLFVAGEIVVCTVGGSCAVNCPVRIVVGGDIMERGLHLSFMTTSQLQAPALYRSGTRPATFAECIAYFAVKEDEIGKWR